LLLARIISKNLQPGIATNSICLARHAGDGFIAQPVNPYWSAVQNATPGELGWFLRNANLRRGMPSWSGLPEQRRWQLVAYLKSFRR